jgi:hypothetical protein
MYDFWKIRDHIICTLENLRKIGKCKEHIISYRLDAQCTSYKLLTVYMDTHGVFKSLV